MAWGLLRVKTDAHGSKREFACCMLADVYVLSEYITQYILTVGVELLPEWLIEWLCTVWNPGPGREGVSSPRANL